MAAGDHGRRRDTLALAALEAGAKAEQLEALIARARRQSVREVLAPTFAKLIGKQAAPPVPEHRRFK